MDVIALLCGEPFYLPLDLVVSLTPAQVQCFYLRPRDESGKIQPLVNTEKPQTISLYDAFMSWAEQAKLTPRQAEQAWNARQNTKS